MVWSLNLSSDIWFSTFYFFYVLMWRIMQGSWFLSSLIGAFLIIAGLYSVLWGKRTDGQSEALIVGSEKGLDDDGKIMSEISVNDPSGTNPMKYQSKWKLVLEEEKKNKTHFSTLIDSFSFILDNLKRLFIVLTRQNARLFIMQNVRLVRWV